MKFLRGSKRRVKPIAQKVDMTSTGPAKEVDQDAYERGYNAALEELVEGDSRMTREHVVEILESTEHSSRHGKTIAKVLRQQWGMDD